MALQEILIVRRSCRIPILSVIEVAGLQKTLTLT